MRSNLFGGGGFELALLHHLGDVLDRHHLAFEHRENLGQRDGAHLHVAQGKLLARDAPREIIHQLFFADGVAVHDAALLALERFALEDLRNAPAQEFDARLHVLLEAVGLAARQREQAGPVRVLEIVDIATVRGRLGLRPQFFDHALDHAAAAGAGKAADEGVVAWPGELDAHLERAQSAVLAHGAGDGLGLRGRVVRDALRIAAPAELFGQKFQGASGWFGGHGRRVRGLL